MKKLTSKIKSSNQDSLKRILLKYSCMAVMLIITLQVNAQVPIAPSVQTPLNPCSNANSSGLTYSVSSPQPGTTYNWIFEEYTSVSIASPLPVLVQGNASGSNVTYTWQTNNGGTIKVTGTNTSGTGPTTILVVAACCYGSGSTNQYLNPPFTISYATNSINGCSFTNNPNPIYINGIIDFIGNFTITNCPNIRMGAKSKMTVAGNNTLNLISTSTADNRTTMRAGCDASWDGILLKDENSKIVVNKATIEDAMIAIECNNGAIFTLLNNAVLNKNEKGIVVNSYTASVGSINNYLGSITNSYILSGTVTYTTSNSNVASYTSNGIVLRGWRAYLGIEFNGSFNKPTYFVVGSAAAGFNVFDNLTIGIMNRNASLTAVKNKFSNIKFSTECTACSGCTGKAICSTNSNSNLATNLIVGDITTANSNTFYICDNGVFASINQNVTVKNNTFNYIYGGTQSAPTGNAIEIEKCKGVIGYTNSHSVTNNDINHVNLGIWVHNNDGASTIEILNNKINFTSGSKAIPNGTGIVAQQNSNGSPTVLYVNTNKIIKLKTGIQIDQFYHPICGGNLVDFITQVASTTWAYGIVVTNSPGAEIKSNTARSSGINYWHTGIKSDFCPNSEVSCNKVENIGFGFQIGGTQTAMKFTSNQMITNTVGLGLGYTAIGDQTLLGSIASPSDNTWAGTFVNHTKSDYSNVVPGFSKLNLQGPSGTIYYPSGMSNIQYPPGFPYNSVTVVGNVPGSQPPCAPAPLIALGGGNSEPVEATIEYEALDIIGSSSNGALYEESLKWHDKYYLYSYLKGDTTLSGSDTIITNFEDSVKLATMGSIEEGEQLLGNLKDATSTEIADLLTEISNVVPDNQVEQNMQDLQIMELQQQISNSGYSLQEINDFKSLAIQCPYEAGVAVYKARVILAGIEGPTKVYVNACERITTNTTSSRKINTTNFETNSFTNISLSPNPCSFNFTIDVEGVSSFTGTIEVYDLFGKLVFTSVLLSPHSKISTNTLSSGFYFYKVVDEVNVLLEGKLIIVK